MRNDRRPLLLLSPFSFLLSAASALAQAPAPAAPPAPFSLDCTGPGGPPFVQPWKEILLDPEWAGQFAIAGDVDGDGEVEFLAARNEKQALTSLIVYRLDGSVLWRWGTAGAGSVVREYDLPLQVHDADGDGRAEVWFGIAGWIVVADGATGRELRRHPLPEGLAVADCIVFASLTRPGAASDVVIKDRYTTLWAFDPAWRPLWSVRNPGGYKTCHHPELFDLDGDGLDAVMTGYVLVDPKGAPLWTFASEKADLSKRGHLDCARLVRAGAAPADHRLVLTCCGADNVALVDGTGKRLWEHQGLHFESADVGEVRPDVPGREIVVDVDHRPWGDSPVWVLSEAGEKLGTINTNYGRYHDLADWDGDGADEIVLGNARCLVDGRGRHVASFATDGEIAGRLNIRVADQSNECPFTLVGDFTGDGRADVALHSHKSICIYRNPSTTEPKRRAPPGTGRNFTLY